jgi:SpoVK/Ycf46/Vps4 family AAA+-type ATPase
MLCFESAHIRPYQSAVSQDMSKEPVTLEDLQMAMKRINPSVSPIDIKRHEEWRKEFSSE